MKGTEEAVVSAEIAAGLSLQRHLDGTNSLHLSDELCQSFEVALQKTAMSALFARQRALKAETESRKPATFALVN